MKVGICHTSYSNMGCLKFLRLQNFETRVCPTGVKHLHAAASQYELSIFFEHNGHGSLLIQRRKLEELFNLIQTTENESITKHLKILYYWCL